MSDCTCTLVENPWTYYGTVEPGGALEPDPECPVHFPVVDFTPDPISEDFRVALEQIREQKEAWLIQMFGSEEGVRVMAERYQLREGPIEFVTDDPDSHAMRATQKVWFEPRLKYDVVP